MAQGDGKGQQESQQKPEPRADEEAVLDENLFDKWWAGYGKGSIERVCVFD